MRDLKRRSLLLCGMLAAASLCAIAQAQDETDADRFGRISGLITDSISGQPVEGALLVLTGIQNSHKSGAVTGAGGRYEITRIEPGTYHLEAQADGYVNRWYGKSQAARQRLTITPGAELTGIDLKLTQAGAVSGIVEDEEGRPVALARVTPLREWYIDGRWTWGHGGLCFSTDDRGTYRCYGLEPGRYIVRATYPSDRNERLLLPRSSAPEPNPAPKRAYVEMYHPSAFSPADAVQLTLAPGEERTGINVRLVRVPVASIRGRVVDESGNVQMGVSVSAYRAGQPRSAPAAHTHSLSGEPFDLPVLMPGLYRIGARRDNRHAWTEVELGEADVNGIELVLVAGGPVRGQVVHARGSECEQGDPGGRYVHLRSLAPDGFYRTPIQSDGSFLFDEVSPGEYEVTLWDAQETCVVSSVLVSGSTRESRTIQVARDGLSGVQIVPRRVGSVRGTVVDSEGRPVAGAVILCAQRDERSGNILAACDPVSADQDGRYHKKLPTLGEVNLIALREYEPGDPLPPTALDRATLLIVEENAQFTADLSVVQR